MSALDQLIDRFADVGNAAETAYAVLREAIVTSVLKPGTLVSMWTPPKAKPGEQQQAFGIGFHVKAACEQGASEQEVAEALGMAIYMGAGPSVMYASHALDAFRQFANERRGAAIMSNGDNTRTASSAPQA